MLSFEITDNGGSISINANNEGLRKLIGILEKLLHSDPTHVHICSPPRGHELDDKTPWGKDAISEVIINSLGDD